LDGEGPKRLAHRGEDLVAVLHYLENMSGDAPEFVRSLHTDHAYAQALTDFCAVNGVPTLSQLLGDQQGQLFSSVEATVPTPRSRPEPPLLFSRGGSTPGRLNRGE
jgi:hypothetical protein